MTRIELIDYPQWILWKYKQHESKKEPSKVPVNVVGKSISALNKKNWRTYGDAVNIYLKNQDKIDGIGFVFTEDDPFVGIDIDSISLINGWEEIVERFDSYTEWSPSKKGLHIITKGYTKEIKVGSHESGEIAIADANRFFTVTLDTMNGYEEIRENQEALDWLQNSLDDAKLLRAIVDSKDREKFIDLYGGIWANRYPSQSEADIAFCRLLANKEAPMHQIDRVYRKSKLMRDKWNEKRGDKTYGYNTIEKVFIS